MAAKETVKAYLAHWMQLGKKLVIQGADLPIVIAKVIDGELYSQEFEQLWDQISSAGAKPAHLEHTDQTISELLSPHWEMIDCARCELLIPCVTSGPRQIEDCPCNNLSSWPNLTTIAPRIPIITARHLTGISDRLNLRNQEDYQASNELSGVNQH